MCTQASSLPRHPALLVGWWWWMMMMMNETKMFSDFFIFFLEIKFTWKKFAVFWKILKNLFFCGKKSNLNFQNRGYFGKKMFRKFLETWHTFRTPKVIFFNFRKSARKKKSNFNFQNRGYFGEKKCSSNFLKLRS